MSEARRAKRGVRSERGVRSQEILGRMRTAPPRISPLYIGAHQSIGSPTELPFGGALRNTAYAVRNTAYALGTMWGLKGLTLLVRGNVEAESAPAYSCAIMLRSKLTPQ